MEADHSGGRLRMSIHPLPSGVELRPAFAVLSVLHEVAPFGVAADEGVRVLFDECSRTPRQALMLAVLCPGEVDSVFGVRREQHSQLTFETVEPSVHLSAFLSACFDRLFQ
ncbi:hypothetical protein ACFU9B_35360 [Streptomyces sp. NPDC057592]|uniref:hypothetical protein n=1 Tax=unclassified Streptomyces TaxID=2593676 RepID=UPI00369C614F